MSYFDLYDIKYNQQKQEIYTYLSTDTKITKFNFTLCVD